MEWGYYIWFSISFQLFLFTHIVFEILERNLFIRIDGLVNSVNDKVDSLENELTLYKALYDSEKSHNTDVSNISKMSIDELKVKVHTQANEIINLTRINDGLTKENTILREQLDTTLRK